MTAALPAEKLPVWRLVLGLAVLAAMVTVLALLAPVYLENYRLQQTLTRLSRTPQFAATPDDTLRMEVLAEAKALHLPVRRGDVKIDRSRGLDLQVAYVVAINLALYRVDLHFHPSIRAARASNSQ